MNPVLLSQNAIVILALNILDVTMLFNTPSGAPNNSLHGEAAAHIYCHDIDSLGIQ